MKKLPLFFVLIISILVSVPAYGQKEHFAFGGGIGAKENLGYKNPDFFLKSDVAIKLGKRFVFTGEALFLTADKIETNDAWTVRGGVSFRTYLNESGRGLFFSPGVGLRHYETSRWTKTFVSPVVTLGYNHDWVIPFLEYSFRDLTSPNKVSSVSVGSEFYIPFSEKWGLKITPSLWVIRFDQPPWGRITGYRFNAAYQLYYRW